MPRRRLPHLRREVARGKVFWYFRRGWGKRIRLPGEFGSREFMRAYEDALCGAAPRLEAPQPISGTLSWLVARYQESVAWEKLSAATKSQRGNLYKAALRKAGDVPLSAIDRQTMQEAMAACKDRPFAANDFLKAMRGLFRWACKWDLIKTDPTEGVEGYPDKTDGWHTWTESEISAFESRWPIGTRERLALSLLLYTGLRRGDVVRLGRQHVKDGVISMRTEKNGVQVAIPCLARLAAVINASPTSELAFMCGEGGRPMKKESFGNWFADACKAADVPGAPTDCARLGPRGQPRTGPRKPSCGLFSDGPITRKSRPIMRAWRAGRGWRGPL
jgi:integrase